jgi:hypothetical protein
MRLNTNHSKPACAASERPSPKPSTSRGHCGPIPSHPRRVGARCPSRATASGALWRTNKFARQRAIVLLRRVGRADIVRSPEDAILWWGVWGRTPPARRRVGRAGRGGGIELHGARAHPSGAWAARAKSTASRCRRAWRRRMACAGARAIAQWVMVSASGRTATACPALGVACCVVALLAAIAARGRASARPAFTPSTTP